jgi:DNA-binding NtrC family response regulator
MTKPAKNTLLAIIEMGGYPNFTPLYQKMGYEVVVMNAMRKVLSFLKKNQPTVIVAEFNFQPSFRDRTSNLESLLAVVQRMPKTKVIVFYEREYGEQLEKLRIRFPLFDALPYPIEAQQLEEQIKQLSK